MRTGAAKLFDRLIGDIELDLGGHEQLSAIERSLVEGFVGSTVLMTDLNTRLALGQEIDFGAHASCVSAMVRVASRLGNPSKDKGRQFVLGVSAAAKHNRW